MKQSEDSFCPKTFSKKQNINSYGNYDSDRISNLNYKNSLVFMKNINKLQIYFSNNILTLLYCYILWTNLRIFINALAA